MDVILTLNHQVIIRKVHAFVFWITELSESIVIKWECSAVLISGPSFPPSICHPRNMPSPNSYLPSHETFCLFMCSSMSSTYHSGFLLPARSSEPANYLIVLFCLYDLLKKWGRKRNVLIHSVPNIALLFNSLHQLKLQLFLTQNKVCSHVVISGHVDGTIKGFSNSDIGNNKNYMDLSFFLPLNPRISLSSWVEPYISAVTVSVLMNSRHLSVVSLLLSVVSGWMMGESGFVSVRRCTLSKL